MNLDVKTEKEGAFLASCFTIYYHLTKSTENNNPKASSEYIKKHKHVVMDGVFTAIKKRS